MMQRILMQPGEVLAVPLPSIAGLSPVEVQDSAIVTVVTRGYVVGSAPLSTLLSDGRINLSGGTAGELYLVTINATRGFGVGGQAEVSLPGGGTFMFGEGADSGWQMATVEAVTGQAEIEVECIDLSWSMPDGGAPWLTIAQFVRRFGHDETVRMTDARGDGRIERDLLVNALTDAQAMAEAHVAGRVKITPDSVPALIQVIVADLARARLYPSGAPEGIEGQAKVAMRNLEKIQSGQMTLGAEIPATAESDAPILFSKKPSRYPDGLKGF